MSKSLRVLLVEDSQEDAELLELELRRGGYDPVLTRVETADDLRRHLQNSDWDIIISDYSMPYLNGMDALAICTSAGHDIPFILLSGVVGEDVAIDAMVHGAHDYVMKDKPARLIVAIDRELREARLRLEKRENEERYRTLFETMVQGVIFRDADGRVKSVNPAAERILGFTHSQMLGRSFADSLWRPISEEERPIPSTEHPALVALMSGKPVLNVILGTVPPGETRPRWALIDAIPRSRPGESAPFEVFTTITDITERKEAEEEAARLLMAVEQAAEAIVVADAQGNIQYANPAMARISGYARSEILGQNPRILQSGKHDKAFYEELWKTLLRGDVWSGHFINRRKDGTLYEEESSISPVHNASGAITNYVGVKRDVTREIELEQHLRQAQKMEALGTLSGGIAHDFNNILQSILGYAELARNDMPERSPAALCLREIVTAGERARDLVAQILAFSRPTGQEYSLVHLPRLAKEVLKLLRGTIPSTIELNGHISDKCGPVLGDMTRIHQVIMNLCTNAYHAMRETGGVLDVHLDEVRVDAALAAMHTDLHVGAYARLAIADTGCGMDEATMKRIFDPYFTTKKVGEGSGLGLSVVHGVVKDMKGAVLVESAVGNGTRFEVFLPLCPADVTAPQAPEHRVSALDGTERILFVDDEIPVARMMQVLLSQHGYQVQTCRDGMEALELFRAAPDYYDVVVTDQTMPRLTGIQLAEELLRLRPDLPIILCTGYSDLVDEAKAKSCGIREFVPKPFSSQKLLQTIRRVLDGGGQDAVNEKDIKD